MKSAWPNPKQPIHGSCDCYDDVMMMMVVMMVITMVL